MYKATIKPRSNTDGSFICYIDIMIVSNIDKDGLIVLGLLWSPTDRKLETCRINIKYIDSDLDT